MAGSNIPRPRVACEVSAERVVVARASQGALSLEAVNAQNLPTGTVTPGLQHANVSAHQALVSALRDSLAVVAGRSRDLTLVIPDASTRILLLDFDTLPEKPQDADSVVRFRLKKSLPFDVDTSSVSYDRHPADNGVRVVAAVTPKTVLEEKLYGIDDELGSNAIPVHVHHLRRKLLDSGATVEIHTVRGVGYLLVDQA